MLSIVRNVHSQLIKMVIMIRIQISNVPMIKLDGYLSNKKHKYNLGAFIAPRYVFIFSID
jgi:hypothetical protein